MSALLTDGEQCFIPAKLPQNSVGHMFPNTPECIQWRKVLLGVKRICSRSVWRGNDRSACETEERQQVDLFTLWLQVLSLGGAVTFRDKASCKPKPLCSWNHKTCSFLQKKARVKTWNDNGSQADHKQPGLDHVILKRASLFLYYVSVSKTRTLSSTWKQSFLNDLSKERPY